MVIQNFLIFFMQFIFFLILTEIWQVLWDSHIYASFYIISVVICAPVNFEYMSSAA